MWNRVKAISTSEWASTFARIALWWSLRFIVVLAVLSALCGLVAGVWVSLLLISLMWLLSPYLER